MRLCGISALLLVIGLFFGTGPVLGSTVPPLINYQGYLTDPNGHPVLTGGYTLTFRIYDHPTATPCRISSGSVCADLVWGPQIFDGVRVDEGFFNVILGPHDVDGDPIAKAFTSPNRYIEVTLEGDAPNLPRHRVLSTPFALKSSGETPVGGIIMFSGKEEDLPENWKVCNGKIVSDPESPLQGKRLPNLQGLFVRGAKFRYEVGLIRGQDEVKHTHRVHVDTKIKRNSLNGYITRTIPCFRKQESQGYSDCLHDYSISIYKPYDAKIRGLPPILPEALTKTHRHFGKHFVTDDPEYYALIKKRGSDDSHGHHVTTKPTVNPKKLENRPRHMNLHYIIRIK